MSIWCTFQVSFNSPIMKHCCKGVGRSKDSHLGNVRREKREAKSERCDNSSARALPGSRDPPDSCWSLDVRAAARTDRQLWKSVWCSRNWPHRWTIRRTVGFFLLGLNWWNFSSFQGHVVSIPAQACWQHCTWTRKSKAQATPVVLSGTFVLLCSAHKPHSSSMPRSIEIINIVLPKTHPCNNCSRSQTLMFLVSVSRTSMNSSFEGRKHFCFVLASCWEGRQWRWKREHLRAGQRRPDRYTCAHTAHVWTLMYFTPFALLSYPDSLSDHLTYPTVK